MAITPMLDGYIPLEDILESLRELQGKEIEKAEEVNLKNQETQENQDKKS
ncbi:hypothetical protein [Staphylococcus simulans]